MANQTITTNTNFDSLTGLLAGETTTVNSGATLTIDSDPQLNRVLPGSITVNDGLFFVDATKVRELDFSGASVLPAIGDTLTAGSITGQVIGVLGTTTAGSIRLRSLNGSIANGTALSFTGGKTATAASSDRVGWLNILGAETTLVSVPRLGEMRVRGQWYQLGVSNGAASQTFTHYSTSVIPCIWVETGNGTGIYEKYLNAGSRFPSEVGVGVRGKFFGMTNGNATITFGNGTNGEIPPNGARIRVPNITIGSALTSAPTTPTVNATLGSWWELSVANGGKIDAEICNFSAFYLNMIGGFEADLTSCGATVSIVLQNMSAPSNFEDVGVGLSGTLNAFALNTTSSLTANNCDFARWNTSGNANAIDIFDADGVSFTNCRFTAFARTVLEMVVNVNRGFNINFDTCDFIGGGLRLTAITGSEIKNCSVWDRSGTQGLVATTPNYGIIIQTASSQITIDGWRQTAIPPYLGIATVINSCNDIKIRNIGTALNPVNCLNHAALLLESSGKNTNIDIARCYLTNTRSRPLLVSNRTVNLTVQNCYFDYSDRWETSALNFIAKGIAAGNNAFGASAINVSQGSVYGTIFADFFLSATTGGLAILGNEKTTETSNYYEITAGTPKFNGAGSLLMRSVGDQIIYTWPWFVLGHTGFANIAPTFSGSSLGNQSYEYRLDTGSGFSGTWKTLSGANLSAETISASTGFRLQLRITCITANASNAIAGILIPTTTTATDQLTLYPIDQVEATLSFTGLIPGSEIRIFRNSDSAELAGVESSGSTFSYTYIHEGIDVAVTVNIIKPGYVYQSIPLTLTASSNSLPIQQRVDYSYA
jgi:hypothetical protein